MLIHETIMPKQTMELKNSTIKKIKPKSTDNANPDTTIIRSDTFGVLCDINCHRWITTLLSYSMIYPQFNLPSNQHYRFTSVHEIRRKRKSDTFKQAKFKDSIGYQQSLSCFCLSCHLCCCCFDNGICCCWYSNNSNIESNSSIKIPTEDPIIDDQINGKNNPKHSINKTDTSIMIERKDSDLKSSLPNAVSSIIAIASTAKSNEDSIIFNPITKDSLPAMTADDLSIITLPPTRQQQQQQQQSHHNHNHHHQQPIKQQAEYYFSSDRSGSKTDSSSTNISINRSWFCCLTPIWKRFLMNLLFILIAIRYVFHVSK